MVSPATAASRAAWTLVWSPPDGATMRVAASAGPAAASSRAIATRQRARVFVMLVFLGWGSPGGPGRRATLPGRTGAVNASGYGRILVLGRSETIFGPACGGPSNDPRNRNKGRRVRRAKPTFQKRQKELARQEKKKAKQDRLEVHRAKRAEEREANPETFDIEIREDLDLADNEAIRDLMTKTPDSD